MADPTVSHNDEDMEKAAEAYAKEKIDTLIEKKKAIIADGTEISINDEEFLIFHNCTMYRAAKAEYIRKTEELYNAMNGVPGN